jgi:hypothetical protein
MDNKWRTTQCPSCGGAGMRWLGEDVGECKGCDGSGQLWIRPSGHCFEYPGGPGQGMWSKEEYEKSTPVMPYEWHFFKDFLTAEAPLDRFGNLEPSLPVTCECGWAGTIAAHDIHYKEAQEKFIIEHRAPVV